METSEVCNLLRMNANYMSSVELQYTVMFNFKTVSSVNFEKNANHKSFLAFFNLGRVVS